jgi:hypothetical protein
MKIYWVVCKDWGKCYFKITKESAQKDCDFRMDKNNYNYLPNIKPDPPGSWYVREEEVPDEDFGYCINGLPDNPAPALVLPYHKDCSVGMVRKIRHNVDNDDGTCKTCPYYFKNKIDALKEM